MLRLTRRKCHCIKELEAMFKTLVDSGMVCPACGRKMNWRKSEGVSTIVTLQHDRAGDLRLICLGCNSRHQHYPGDSFYDLPEGKKHCPSCGKIKPLAEFYPHPTYFLGVRTACQMCERADALEYLERKRQS